MGILRKRHAALLFVWVLFVWVLFCPVATASPIQMQEQKIKAGLLYHFIKYSTWPDNAFETPEEAFNVCLLGGDPFDKALDPLQGRAAQQRQINIYNIEAISPGLRCHLVFVHRNLAPRWPDLLKTLAFQPILNISDIPDFAGQGGMVEFATSERQRIELRLNTPAIHEAGLEIGEPLMKLATE